jgi:hypothetical protein
MIQSKIEFEGSIAHFLYLSPNFDLLLFLVRRFESCQRPVYFGLWKDFLAHGLGLSVRNNRTAVSTTLLTILALKPPGPSSRTSPAG